MKLIIDANVIISSLIAIQGKTTDIIFNDNIELYSPEFLLEEIEKHKDEILEKSSLKKEEFNLFFLIICSKINFIPYEEFKDFISEAEQISPDVNDAEYFALALKFKCPIWSNDKLLKHQDKVNIISTEELITNFKFE